MQIKNNYMETIIVILTTTIGTPLYPDTIFDWTYELKGEKGKKKTITGLSPITFYKQYCDINFNDYVSIVNDPRPRHPYWQTYEKHTTPGNGYK